MHRLAALLPLAAFACCAAAPGGAGDLMIASFEAEDYAGWTAQGTAFGKRPRRGVPEKPLTLQNCEGSGVAGSLPGQETLTGELLSPEFVIQRPYLAFLVWGQRHLPSQVGVELLTLPSQEDPGGKIVRAASATEAFDPSRSLHWRTFDVRDLAGRAVRIRVNDRSPTGAIAVDSFLQSNAPRSLPTDAARLFGETFRPQFHFTARCGWLNDANGLLHADGTWHLFHQHRPPGAEATVWGHAVSGDLLHWRHGPTALPNEGTDAMFSGSGLVDEMNASGLGRPERPPLLLFYTHQPKTNSGRKSTQCMAFSTDQGRTFAKFPGNPLLATRDLTDRDPKVFYHAPSKTWIMVLSLARNNTDRERAAYGLFRSHDLKSWELLQEIGPGSWYWECPDMFELALDGDPHRTRWILAKGSGDYLVGTFDGERFRPESGPVRTQWGACYYGAQTFSNAPGGRRIQIGWMNSGPKADAPNAFPGMPFNQQMSFPRELSLRSTPEGPRLFAWPVREIERLVANTRSFPPGTLVPGHNPLAGVRHDLLDLELEAQLPGPGTLRFDLRGMELRYDAAAGKLRVLDRAIDLPAPGGKLALRVLLDRTSFELFANSGAVTHSRVFFPDPANRRLALEAEGGPVRILRLEWRELETVWGDAQAAGSGAPGGVGGAAAGLAW